MKETLQQLQERAAKAGCSLEIEFLAEQGSGEEGDEGFTECGSYSIKFKPYPRIEGFVGWGGALPYVPDELALSHEALDEFEKGLPGCQASDYEVVEYDISGFENVMYPNIEEEMMEAVSTAMTVKLDEQLSEAAKDMFGVPAEDLVIRVEDINWLQDVDHGIQNYAPQQMTFDGYDVAKEIADDVDNLALESLLEESNTINAFDKCKPTDLD